MITEDRLSELETAWNDSPLWSDEEYRDWYEGLTEEEQAQIDAWDKQYNKGVLRLCQEILKHSEAPKE